MIGVNISDRVNDEVRVNMIKHMPAIKTTDIGVEFEEKPKTYAKDNDLLATGKKTFERCESAERDNREIALEDIK